jgi:hypothetical protein
MIATSASAKRAPCPRAVHVTRATGVIRMIRPPPSSRRTGWIRVACALALLLAPLHPQAGEASDAYAGARTTSSGATTDGGASVRVAGLGPGSGEASPVARTDWSLPTLQLLEGTLRTALVRGGSETTERGRPGGSFGVRHEASLVSPPLHRPDVPRICESLPYDATAPPRFS